MLDPIINILNDQTPLFPPLGKIVVIAAVFVLAWLVARASGRIARRFLGWHDRRHRAVEETGKIANAKRRETLVALIRAGIAMAAFTTATVLAIGQLTGGIDRLGAIAGVSFAVIVAGFAAQRVLADLIAGLTMFLESWYSVGDPVILQAGLELQGVVEDMSLRRTRLRALNGEIINVHNAQIQAARVLPRGVKNLAIELFVSDRADGEELVEGVMQLLPDGPTTFLERPRVATVEELSESLTRISIVAAVAPGREWLAEGFLADLLKERAADGLIVHGPVTLAVDERAARSYARATSGTRWQSRKTEIAA